MGRTWPIRPPQASLLKPESAIHQKTLASPVATDQSTLAAAAVGSFLPSFLRIPAAADAVISSLLDVFLGLLAGCSDLCCGFFLVRGFAHFLDWVFRLLAGDDSVWCEPRQQLCVSRLPVARINVLMLI